MSLKAPLPVGTTRTRPVGARRSRLFLLAALVALIVTVATVFYWVSANRFTGFRVVAPGDECWIGSMSGGIRSLVNVSGCGSTSFPVE